MSSETRRGELQSPSKTTREAPTESLRLRGWVGSAIANRRSLGALLALLASCATPHEFAAPDASWKTRTGQLKYTSGERVLIGEVVVSRKGATDFQIEFQKGGGLPLLKLRMDATVARAEGLFARGLWQGAPERAPKPLRGWVGLREAFSDSMPEHFTFTPRDSQERFDFILGR